MNRKDHLNNTKTTCFGSSVGSVTFIKTYQKERLHPPDPSNQHQFMTAFGVQFLKKRSTFSWL